MTDERESTNWQVPHEKGPAVATSDGGTLECSLCEFESFDYHPEEGAYVAVFDAHDVTPSTAVVGVLSTVAETDPHTMDPLYASVDTDALDTLFGGETPDQDLHATFTIGGYEVNLSSQGGPRIRVREAAARANRHEA